MTELKKFPNYLYIVMKGLDSDHCLNRTCFLQHLLFRYDGFKFIQSRHYLYLDTQGLFFAKFLYPDMKGLNIYCQSWNVICILAWKVCTCVVRVGIFTSRHGKTWVKLSDKKEHFPTMCTKFENTLISHYHLQQIQNDTTFCTAF